MVVGKVDVKFANGFTESGAPKDEVRRRSESNKSGVDEEGVGDDESDAIDDVSDPESDLASYGVDDGIGRAADGEPATVRAAKAEVGDVPKRNCES